MQELPRKPYLIRALHEWCTDNGYTPYIVVTVDKNTIVPPAHIQDGQITLNISTLATNRLVLGNEYIEFQTRFGGVTEQIYVPVAAVSAIYARETGAGMGFEVAPSEPYPGGDASDDKSAEPGSSSGEDNKPDDPPPSRPRLTVVK